MELKLDLDMTSTLTRALLIELYGIETDETCASSKVSGILLIELYGIETAILHGRIYVGGSFNRTIWN